jgi:hypothetical protein
LILLGIGVVGSCVQSVYSTAFQLRAAFFTQTWQWLIASDATPKRSFVVLGALELVFGLWMLAYSGAIAVLFFRRKRGFPFHYRVAVAAFLGFNVMDIAVTWQLGHGSFRYQGDGPALMRCVFAALIWIPYTYLSRRVAQTFVFPVARYSPPGDVAGADVGGADPGAPSEQQRNPAS